MADLTSTQTRDLTLPAKYGHMAFDVFLAVSNRVNGTLNCTFEAQKLIEIVRVIGEMGICRRHDTRQAAMGLARAPVSRHGAHRALCTYFHYTFTYIHALGILFYPISAARPSANLKTIKAVS